MSLRELYQEVIVDHSKNPRHFGELADANHTKEGFNPLCGDRLTVFVKEDNGVVADISFKGTGCAISIASASLMSQALLGRSFADVEAIFQDFHQVVTLGHNDVIEERLGKLAVLSGVAQYPVRVKCATLAWHTVKAAIGNDPLTVTTE